MTEEIRDAAGRIMTREHPEDVLLKKLGECESLRDVLEFCIWVLDELGYKRLARAARRRLEQAIEEAAGIEQQALDEAAEREAHEALPTAHEEQTSRDELAAEAEMTDPYFEELAKQYPGPRDARAD